MSDTNPRHLSESNEHYTPTFIVDAARETLGFIDLDPATCPFANKLIRASCTYTTEDDGFTKNWHGRVFLNPPGGRSDNKQRPVVNKCRETGACGLPPGHTHDGVEPSQKKWWFKLAKEYGAGRVHSAIFVCFSIELLQTTQVDTPANLLIPLDFAICFPSKRVPYDHEEAGDRVSGSQPPHASCIIYMGPNVRGFDIAFSGIGRVVLPNSAAA